MLTAQCQYANTDLPMSRCKDMTYYVFIVLTFYILVFHGNSTDFFLLADVCPSVFFLSSRLSLMLSLVTSFFFCLMVSARPCSRLFLICTP